MEVAHPQSGSSSTWFLVELEFGSVGFWGEGKTRVPRRKTSRNMDLFTWSLVLGPRHCWTNRPAQVCTVHENIYDDKMALYQQTFLRLSGRAQVFTWIRQSVLINLSLWLRWWWCKKTRLFQIFHYKQITIRNRNFDHTKMFQIYTVSYIFLYVNIFTSITYFLTSTPTVLLFKFDLS